MTDFVASFHTHVSALMTDRALKQAGITSRMAPVPRKLSSSCGTCVLFTAPEPCQALLDADAERLWQITGPEQYILLWENEE
jgi:hypothetical protein